MHTTPLAAHGGASGVGASIASYVESCDADMVVLGSRGLHGWQRCEAGRVSPRGANTCSSRTACQSSCAAGRLVLDNQPMTPKTLSHSYVVCLRNVWLSACRHVYNLLGLGSVSYYTMLRVPCPVVVVKGDES